MFTVSHKQLAGSSQFLWLPNIFKFPVFSLIGIYFCHFLCFPCEVWTLDYVVEIPVDGMNTRATSVTGSARLDYPVIEKKAIHQNS